MSTLGDQMNQELGGNPGQPVPAPPTTNPSPPVQPGLPPVHIEGLPPATPDYLHPVVEPPKHKYHPKTFRNILIVALIVSLLGVGLAVAYTLMPGFFAPATQKTTTPTKNTAAPAAKLTAEKEVAKLKDVLKGDKTARSAVTIPVKTAGNDFYTVIPDLAEVKSTAADIAPDKVDASIAAMQKVLTDDKMVQTVRFDGKSGAVFLADFVHDDITCQITATAATADAKATRFIEGKCLNIAQYTAYAAIQRPFYDVYSPAQSASVETAFIGKPTISNSRTAGYHFTEVSVARVVDRQTTAAGTMAMFYQTPDNIWHYFKDRAQRLIECEQYNTDPLKYAYVGQPCHSLQKDIDITVAPPPKRS